MSTSIIYLLFALVLLVFVLLTWYSVHRVFSVPHPYKEARAVTVVFVLLSIATAIWATALLLDIDWSLFL